VSYWRSIESNFFSVRQGINAPLEVGCGIRGLASATDGLSQFGLAAKQITGTYLWKTLLSGNKHQRINRGMFSPLTTHTAPACKSEEALRYVFSVGLLRCYMRIRFHDKAVDLVHLITWASSSHD
jgi:hypothetical protein